MIFETNRLRVRKLTISDLNDFHKMQSDIEVMRYITGSAATFEQSEAKLNEWIARYETKVMEWPYAVTLKENGSFVGICGVIENNEIGYRFLKQYWYNGYGTALVEGLILFSKQLGLKKLMAEVIIENTGSYKILKRAGFTVVKEQVCKYTKLPEYIMNLEL
ncbi:Protein N-acetyltransferase, RimJ/RimL family [Lutibacter agarilyticus]|uniref:Protein N-acetyltransferase, RimJ/RimL family n=1 Tax=Lutibacter agarilyticus TaxID=1109740 RepID=A0A238YVF4_9FLAO|nr:GNAT family N-acetyltransferase [Lutibacter agarilyticus]SNR75107.1 Protein N-acetyltransferase, RimJ/RimL family [Lutibacter agarilyticus]